MVPIFLTHILEYSLLLVTIVSVGHLGTAELAASSLGSMTINVCALSLVQGLCVSERLLTHPHASRANLWLVRRTCTHANIQCLLAIATQAALDTLCSQSYSSPNPKTTSLHALRTAVLTVIILIPATVAIYNGEKILLGLRQDPEVAHLAGRYLRSKDRRGLSSLMRGEFALQEPWRDGLRDCCGLQRADTVCLINSTQHSPRCCVTSSYNSSSPPGSAIAVVLAHPVLIFGLPGYAGFEISRRWLQAQGLMIIPTISLIIASPINVFLNWLLVWGP